MNNQAKMDMNVIQQMQQLEATYFEQKLNSELFPSGRLTTEWKRVVSISMQKTTPVFMRISLKEFASVLKCIDDNFICGEAKLTLFQFGVMSNSIETMSPDDLLLSPVEYADFIDYCMEQIEYYSKRTQEIRVEVKKRAEDDIKRKSLSASNGLKPVIGQA